MADAPDPTPDKAAAQARREAAQAAAAPGNRNIQIVAGLVFAAVVAVVLIVVISGGGAKPAPVLTDASTAQGIPETQKLLAGIEQHGYTLGDPKAPLNILEFLDVQCPYCQAHQLDEQPTVIAGVVKTGKATLTMQPVAVLGEDSERGRIVVTKVAATNHAWDFLNLWYWNQRPEKTGYVTPTFLQKLAEGTPGKPVADMDTNATPAITKQLAAVNAAAKALNVPSVPTFALGRTGAPYSTYKVIDQHATSEPAGQEIVGYVNKALAAK